MQVRAAQHVSYDGPALAVKEPLQLRDMQGRELACFDAGMQAMLAEEYNIHRMVHRRAACTFCRP
jgi:hypothetical protein